MIDDPFLQGGNSVTIKRMMKIHEMKREGDYELVGLQDRDSRSEMWVAPAMGLNWCSWRVGGRELLYRCPDFFRRDIQKRRGGCPLLFPAVARTWDLSKTPPVFGQYRHPNGQTFEMPIHGFAPKTEWERIQGERDETTFAYRLPITDEVRRRFYPYDVNMTIRFTLEPDAVMIDFAVENLGSEPAPFSFGIHPYFQLASRKNVILKMPSRHTMPLLEGMKVPAKPGQVEPGDDYTEGRVVDLTGGVDFPLTRLARPSQEHPLGAELLDSASGRRFRLTFDPCFEDCMIFTDADSPFLCIEPWLPGLGGFGFLHQFPDDPVATGLTVLAPAAKMTGKVRIQVSDE